MRHLSTSSAMLHAARVALATIVFATAGCRSATDSEHRELAACPQTYEFGNFGCARVVALVETPPEPVPAAYRLDVRAVPARPASGAGPSLADEPRLGFVPLQLTLWEPPPPGVRDTLSVWIVARMLEDLSPPVVGVPLPVVAAESTLRVVRWAPVGGVPPVDTVRVVLRRP